MHALVVPAERFRADAAARAGAQALRLFQALAPESVVLARALRLPGWEQLPTDPARVDDLLARLESGDEAVPAGARLAHAVYERVARRLAHAPVQDLRIDLDVSGFGGRAADDDEIDATAAAVGDEIARAAQLQLLPPRIGLVLPPLGPATAARAIRTLDCALSTLAGRGPVPPIVVSVPGITTVEQVAAVVDVLVALEGRLGARKGALELELGISDAEGVLEDGRVRVAEWLAVAAGRCVAVRVDALAVARGLGATRPGAARVACELVQLALAGTGVPLVAGESAPLGADGSPEAVHAAWRSTAEDALAAAANGVLGGWDRDAGQLPARIAAVYAHLRLQIPELVTSLADALDRARRDDAPETVAEGQRRLDRVLQAVDCGAVDPDELAQVGLDGDDLSVGSFRAAVDRRR